jgi:hypothetical protein
MHGSSVIEKDFEFNDRTEGYSVQTNSAPTPGK